MLIIFYRHLLTQK